MECNIPHYVLKKIKVLRPFIIDYTQEINSSSNKYKIYIKINYQTQKPLPKLVLSSWKKEKRERDTQSSMGINVFFIIFNLFFISSLHISLFMSIYSIIGVQISLFVCLFILFIYILFTILTTLSPIPLIFMVSFF